MGYFFCAKTANGSMSANPPNEAVGPDGLGDVRVGEIGRNPEACGLIERLSNATGLRG
jgi:hypothetical protein